MPNSVDPCPSCCPGGCCISKQRAVRVLLVLGAGGEGGGGGAKNGVVVHVDVFTAFGGDARVAQDKTSAFIEPS